MDFTKLYSRRILLWTLIFFILIALMVISAGYAVWRFLFSALPLPVLQEAASQAPEFQAGFDQIRPWIDMAAHFFIPVTGGVFLLLSLIFWRVLRRFVLKARMLEKTGVSEKAEKGRAPADRGKKRPVPAKTGPADDAEAEPRESEADQQARMQRFYLHLLSVLQREGRLVDFFSEDLTPYDDRQIGVAVRNIHDNCGKALNKYLKPKAVIEKQEGEEVLVPKNFDVDAVKLTGNVSGDPPFKGILRHKGWQAGKVELPVLSPGHNPRIIAPAEVEIL